MKYPTYNLSDKQRIEVRKFNSNNNIIYENLNCVNCNLSNYKKLYENDRYGIKQQTVMCNNCGFVYSNPRMSEDSLKNFYSSNLYRELYENINNFEHGFKMRSDEIKEKILINQPNYNNYYPQLFIDFICSLNIEYKSVCEIGAGYGTNLIYFKKLGKEIYGLEPSLILTKIAKDNQINVDQGFVDDLKGKYDIIVLKHVFEHLYNPLKNLEKIKNHTNKYLFIEVPGNYRRIASIQNVHNFYFTENTLNKIVINAGFKLIKLDYCKETEFIFAMYEKTNDKNISFKYDYISEINKIKKIYRNDNTRYIITKILKILGIYKLLLPLRKTLLNILKMKP